MYFHWFSLQWAVFSLQFGWRRAVSGWRVFFFGSPPLPPFSFSFRTSGLPVFQTSHIIPLFYARKKQYQILTPNISALLSIAVWFCYSSPNLYSLLISSINFSTNCFCTVSLRISPIKLDFRWCR